MFKPIVRASLFNLGRRYCLFRNYSYNTREFLPQYAYLLRRYAFTIEVRYLPQTDCFTDNVNRRQRVTDLINQSIMIQDEMKRYDKKWQDNDKRAYAYLEKVAKAAGYSTPKEYVNAALALLPKSEQEKWHSMRQKADGVDDIVDRTFDIAGGIFAISLFSRLAGELRSW